MNIRPIDLQVMIPRSTDASKVAALNDRQPVTQQQQLAEQARQALNDRQRQVQTALPGSPEGKVSTEDLNQEKRQEHPEGESDPKHGKEGQQEDDAARKARNLTPPDPIRGNRIDIKT